VLCNYRADKQNSIKLTLRVVPPFIVPFKVRRWF